MPALAAGQTMCPLCHREVARPSRLKAHVLTHLGGQKYQCDICNRGLKDPETLRRHRKQHTDPKTHTCEEPGCGKKFIDASSLRQHKVLHSKPAPGQQLVCEYCDGHYTNLKTFKEHSTDIACRKHPEYKGPYFCHIKKCPRSEARKDPEDDEPGFSRPKDLSKHLREVVHDKKYLSTTYVKRNKRK